MHPWEFSEYTWPQYLQRVNGYFDKFERDNIFNRSLVAMQSGQKASAIYPFKTDVRPKSKSKMDANYVKKLADRYGLKI